MNESPKVELVEVRSSARCDMCGSDNLLFPTDRDSKLYLCKVHKEILEKALKLTEPTTDH